MSQLEVLIVPSFTNTTQTLMMQSEPLEMIVCLFILQCSGSKITIMMQILWLELAMLGTNGTSTSSGATKARMKTKFYTMLFLQSVQTLLLGPVTGSIQVNGAWPLTPILPHSLITTNSSNLLMPCLMHQTKLTQDGLTGPGKSAMMILITMPGLSENSLEWDCSLSLIHLPIIVWLCIQVDQNFSHCQEINFYIQVDLIESLRMRKDKTMSLDLCNDEIIG